MSTTHTEIVSTLTVKQNSSSGTISSAERSAAENRVTVMLISIAFLYTIGTTPYMLDYMLEKVYGYDYTFLESFYSVGSCCLYLLVGLKFFVYYFCNRLFREQINSYLNRLMCVFCKKPTI
jgi:hypothetical protein